MIKFFIGIAGMIIIAAIGWIWTFILMAYQAKADISNLQIFDVQLRSENSEIKAEVRAVKAITQRTEANTEQIRAYLLGKAIPSDSRR